jgi:hypothetical protein
VHHKAAGVSSFRTSKVKLSWVTYKPQTTKTTRFSSSSYEELNNFRGEVIEGGETP